MKQFTVIGTYSDNGQIFAWHVEAENSMHAFAVAAFEIMEENVPDAEFVVCLNGHQSEVKELTFPGSALVDGETIREQPEVFGVAAKYFEVIGAGHYDEEPDEESRVLWVKVSSLNELEQFLDGTGSTISQDIPPVTKEEGLDYDLTRTDGADFVNRLYNFKNNPVPLWKIDQWLSAEDLDNKYNPEGDGEHPTFPRSHWREAVANEGTVSGYWQWCKHMLELKAEGIDS